MDNKLTIIQVKANPKDFSQELVKVYLNNTLLVGINNYHHLITWASLLLISHLFKITIMTENSLSYITDNFKHIKIQDVGRCLQKSNYKSLRGVV
jgi:hypothetical protein